MSPAMAFSRVDLPAPLRRPTKPDAPAGIDRQVGSVQQSSATEPDGGAGNDKQRHDVARNRGDAR